MIPVPQVTDVDRAFPTSDALGESLPALDDIPDEFKRVGTKWGRLFAAAFYFAPVMKWHRVGLLPQKGVSPSQAWRALEVLLGVRDISHEHKEAAWAYLASQWFVDARWELDGNLVPFEDAELEAAWTANLAVPGQAEKERTIGLKVHIGSKGCGDRYMRSDDTPETSRASSCGCPPGTCWVDYARASQKAGVEPLVSELWAEMGRPMPKREDPPTKKTKRRRKK